MNTLVDAVVVLIQHCLFLIFVQPKRQKKEKKEVPKEKKQDVKEVVVHEEPVSPAKSAHDDVKPHGSYELADMDKATFDAVRQ